MRAGGSANAGDSSLAGSQVPAVSPLRLALVQLAGTFRELRGYRNAFLMLLAFLVYNDGIGTIIRMATIYGTEIGINENVMIAAILITQFVGIPFAFLFGGLAGRIGTRPSIFLGLVAYTLISVIGYFMKTGTHFLILAVMVGMVQGGTQALSRSLFASLIPRYQSGQFFGFFAVHVGAVGGAAPAQGYASEREVAGFGAGAAVAPAALHAFGARFFVQDARANTSGARVWRSTASSFAAISSRSPAPRASRCTGSPVRST